MVLQKQPFQRIGGRRGGSVRVGAVLGGGGRVGPEILHPGGPGVGEHLAAVALQRKEIEQHLAVQPHEHFPQIEPAAAGLVIHHPQVGVAVELHRIHPVHRPHHPDGMPRRAGQFHRRYGGGVGVVGVGAVVDAQLEGDRPEAGLLHIPLDKAQQPDQVAADPVQQILHPHPAAGQVVLDVFLHQLLHETFQLFRTQTGESVPLAGQRLFQDPVGQRAADVGGQFRFLPGFGPQHELHEIPEGAQRVPLKPGRADVQLRPQQFFQRLQVLHRRGGAVGRPAQRRQPRSRRFLPAPVQGLLHRGPRPGVLLPQPAQQVQRSRGGGRQHRRRKFGPGHGQQIQRRFQRRRDRQPGRTAGPGQPQPAPRRREGLVKADLLPDDPVLKAVGQLGALGDHGVPVGMGQQAGIPRRLGEFPFRQAQHKAGIGLRQAHPAGGGEDHTVQALGDVPHVGGAQQQPEQVGVFGRFEGVRGPACGAGQLHHIVEQPGDHVPLPQGLVGRRQFPLGPQVFRQAFQRRLGPQGDEEEIDLPGQGGDIRPPGPGKETVGPLHQKGAGLFRPGQILPVLVRPAVGVAAGVAGEGGAPVLRPQRPGIGIVFKGADRFLRQIRQPGLDQAQQCRAAQPAAQQVQGGHHRPGRGGVFRGGGFVAEQRNVLQPEFVPHRRQVGRGVPADHRHAAVGRPGPGPGAHRRRHRLGLLLPAVGLEDGDGRPFRGVGVHRQLGGIPRVGQKKGEFRQRRGVLMAQILIEQLGVAAHARPGRHVPQRRRHLLRPAEHPEAAVRRLQAVAAQTDRHVRRRQHCRQQRPLGRVEGIEFINVHRPAGEEVLPAGFLQPAGRQLLPVARVHAGLGQQAFIRAIDQRQFAEFFGVGTGGMGVGFQLLRADAGALELLDGLGRFLAEGRILALAPVVDHLIQQ